MKIEITKSINQTEKVEVELPYYYSYDADSDYVTVHGKIEEQSCTSILHNKSYTRDEETFEVKLLKFHSIKYSGLSSYFNEDYQSNKEEYEEAKQNLINFLQNLNQ